MGKDTYLNSSAQPKPKVKGVHEKSQIEIFAILVIVLELDATEKWGLFSRQHAYLFEVKQAITEMQSLELAIELTTVTSTVSYLIKPDIAYGLLRKWFAAHLLHCPESRTDNALTESMTVQVTPKGTALVYDYCKSIGLPLDKMPSLVKSLFNSMRLFAFDRSLSRSKVLYSVHLLRVLVSQIMGPKPNVWSPRQAPPAVSNMYVDDKVDFSLSELTQATITAERGTTTSSPFHHKYFTNPESDAHIQYYESQSGLRVYHNKVFRNIEQDMTVEYSFTGKVVVQWLLDCTMLLSMSEAVEVGGLLVKHGFFLAVTRAASEQFTGDSNAFYILSDTGKQACQWHSQSESAGSVDNGNLLGEDLKMMSLSKVLQEPGMRYLFRLHMEKERCAENLNAYLRLMEFMKLCSRLARLLRVHAWLDGPKKDRLTHIIENQAGSCYSMAFSLYLSYLSEESLCDLNIDFGLRQEVRLVILQAQDESLGQLVDYIKTPVVDRLFLTATTNVEEEHILERGDTMTANKMNPECMKTNSIKSEDTDIEGTIIEHIKVNDGKNIMDITNAKVDNNMMRNIHMMNTMTVLDKFNKPSMNSLKYAQFNEIFQPPLGIKTDAKTFTIEFDVGSETEMQVVTSRMLVADTIAALNRIYHVFGRISSAIYRLMEVDSFPKFVRSDGYMYAEGIETRRA